MTTRAVSYLIAPDPDAARRLGTFAETRGFVVLEPFVEGRRPGRRLPELERALARCREARAALLVPELAAVGGDPRFLDPVLAARVRMSAVDVPRVGRRTLELLQAVAHRSRADAGARSRAALASARRRGVRLGSPRPEVGARAGAAALQARAEADAAAVAPAILEMQLSNPGASLRAIAQLLDAQGIATPRGGHWGPSTVRSAMLRTGLLP